MPSVCFCFEVHQPNRLRNYTFFDIGQSHHYWDDEKNREILDKVSEKCYLPANRVMLELINRFEGKFRISYSVTGVLLDQLEAYRPDVLQSFIDLAGTGCVEFVNETYYHTLAFLFSQREFKEQVVLHKKKITSLFGQVPKTFRNTEMIYNNDLARVIESMGYRMVLTEGADQI